MDIEAVTVLVEVVKYGVAAIKKLREFLANREDVVDRAIRSTVDGFPQVQGLDKALRTWVDGEQHLEQFARYLSKDGEADEDAALSILNQLDVAISDKSDRVAFGRLILNLFARNLESTIRKQDDSGFVWQKEELKHDLGQLIDRRMAMLEGRITSQAAAIAIADASNPEDIDNDPVLRQIREKLDSARPLIDSGLIRAARSVLDPLRSEDSELPAQLEFRLLTNLAACALADDSIQEACQLLEEAYELQPENTRAIANAAVAAQLNQQSEKAASLAHQALERDEHNSQAAIVLMMELSQGENPADLQVFLEENDWIREDRQCALALAEIRRGQSCYKEAIEINRSLLEVHSDVADVHLALGESLFALGQHLNRSEGFSAQSELFLIEAESEATSALELYKLTDYNMRVLQSLLLRGCSRAILNKARLAQEDFGEVLRQQPNHADACFNMALLLSEEGQIEEARDLMERIPLSRLTPDASLTLASVYLETGDSRNASRLLRGALDLSNPDWSDIHRAELLHRAEFRSGSLDSVSPLVATSLEKQPNNAKLLTLAAVLRSQDESSKGSEKLLQQALEVAGENDRALVTAHLADFYRREGQFSEAADLYGDLVGGSASHPVSIPLLECLVNGGRLKEALDWAEKVRRNGGRSGQIASDIEAKILEFVGDVPKAIESLKNLRLQNGSDNVATVRLAWSYYRNGNQDAARKTVLEIDRSSLCSLPESLIELAHLKLLLGIEGYLDDAYSARRSGGHLANVHLAYLRLYLRDADSIEQPDEIVPGVAVLLEAGDSQQWWTILNEGEDRIRDHDLLPYDDLAIHLIGKRIDDTVEISGHYDTSTYRIVDIQSKFAREIQETITEFHPRFPDNKDMTSIILDDDDLAPILRPVDARHEMVKQLEMTYGEGSLPFVTFASMLGRTSLELWSACTKGSLTKIRFASNMYRGLDTLSSLMSSVDTLVLDMLALLVIRELELEEILRQQFRRIMIPQSVLDELQQTYAAALLEAKPVSTLGKGDDGLYTYTEITEGQWEEWREFLRGAKEFAESFDRIPSYGLLDATDRREYIDLLTRAGAGTVFAGAQVPEGGAILWCDDQGLGGLAQTVGRPTVNTQEMLQLLHAAGTIDGDAYSAQIERLISLNYFHVAVTASDILSRFRDSNFVSTTGIRAMLGTLEGPDCAEDYAIGVAADVLRNVWEEAPIENRPLILALVRDSLRQGRALSPVLLKLRWAIGNRFADYSVAKDDVLDLLNSYDRGPRR